MLGKTNVKIKPNKIINVDYVEYLKSTGTQYINTGVKPTQDTRVEIKFLQTTKDEFVYGSRTSSSSSDKHCYNHSSTTAIYPQFYDFFSKIEKSYSFNEIYTLKNGKEGFYLNDTLITTYTYSNFASDLSMYLFGLNSNNSLESRTLVGNIYYCKIYENDVLIRDFKPCKNGAGEYCMYDEVEKKYYYNQGSGTFIGGASI